MRIRLLCFSPTGGTKKAAEALCRGLGWETELVSLPGDSAEGEKDELFVFAVPVYGGRVPSVVTDSILQQKGRGKKAVLLVVYGGREFEDALVELSDLVTRAGFHPIAGIAALAQHSLCATVCGGRPNEKDREQLAALGLQIRKKIESGAVSVPEFPGNRPYREYKGSSFRPLVTEACVSCGLCASVCLAGAISPEDPKITKDCCIACMACSAHCPRGARILPEESQKRIAEMLAKTCRPGLENVLFL